MAGGKPYGSRRPGSRPESFESAAQSRIAAVVTRARRSSSTMAWGSAEGPFALPLPPSHLYANRHGLARRLRLAKPADGPEREGAGKGEGDHEGDGDFG